jgi:signal transduction histidine kinase
MAERITSAVESNHTSPIYQSAVSSVVPERKFEGLWQIQLQPLSNAQAAIDCTIAEPLEFGTAPKSPRSIDLSAFGGTRCGVSRRHLKFESDGQQLYITDLGSTNGTRLNEGVLRPHLPYPVKEGDIVSLANLEFTIRIKDCPEPATMALQRQAGLAEALSQIAKALTSRLNLDDILKQALTMAMSLTSAAEATLWLVDEESQELFLEAERGVQDDEIRRMRLPVTDSFVASVIESRKPVRANRGLTGHQIKVKTGYMVEALLYVPLVHGDQVLGVISATHTEYGNHFSHRDECLLTAIGDFVAIAMTNARLYESVREANRIQAEMIQNISHEFRTPLTYIVGYGGLMKEDGDNLRPQQSQSLDIMLHQAKKLTWLTQNFISLEASQHTAAKREATDPAALLADTVASARIIAKDKHIELKMDQADHPLPQVLANALAISQVLDNLVANAIKFTKEDGQITLRARRQGSLVEFSVSDTGIGIPQDAQKSVFDRFFQVDGSSRRSYGGVGIGLSVCKTIVEAHGGKITLQSAPNTGTTFCFTLPIAQPSTAPEAGQKEDDHTNSKDHEESMKS